MSVEVSIPQYLKQMTRFFTILYINSKIDLVSLIKQEVFIYHSCRNLNLFIQKSERRIVVSCKHILKPEFSENESWYFVQVNNYVNFTFFKKKIYSNVLCQSLNDSYMWIMCINDNLDKCGTYISSIFWIR